MTSTHIVHIQRMCTHDGPGIRSTVFVKGCPLRCAWCSNPECQKAGPELAYRRDICRGPALCGHCLEACPNKCLSLTKQGYLHIERGQCTACGACAAHCPAHALSILGQALPLEDIFATIEKDRQYYELSRGGVTISGGEPLTRQEFALAFSQEAKRRNLHCIIQTSGYFDMDDAVVRDTLQHINGLSFDIRHTDSTVHRAYTGVDAARIVENLKRLGREFPQLPISAHTLLVPGFNDNDHVLSEIGRLLAHHPTVCEHTLLPIHTFGQGKYEMLGRETPLSNPQRLSSVQIQQMERAYSHSSILNHAVIGG